jgi:hypothetical protein
MEDNPYQAPSVELQTPSTFRAVIVCWMQKRWMLIWFFLMSIYPLVFIFIGIARFTMPELRYPLSYIPFNIFGLAPFMANGLLVTTMPLFSKLKSNTRLIMMVLGFMVWFGLIAVSATIALHLIDNSARMR